MRQIVKIGRTSITVNIETWVRAAIGRQGGDG